MATFNEMEKKLQKANGKRRMDAIGEENDRIKANNIKLAKERQTKKRFRVGKQPAWRSAKH